MATVRDILTIQYNFNVICFVEINCIKTFVILCLIFNMDLVTFNLIFSNFISMQQTFLLIDLFNHNNIYNIVNFHCNRPEYLVSMQKLFNNNKILVANLKTNGSGSYKISHSYKKLGVVLNTSCDGWQMAFQLISMEDVFKSPFNWFITTENLTATVDILSHYPIEVDSEVTVIYKTGENIFELYEVYNTGFFTHGRFVIKKIGYWDSKLWIEKRNRTDLIGVTLKCTVVVTQRVANETFEEYVERSKLSKSDTLHKLKYFTLLKYLRDMYSIR